MKSILSTLLSLGVLSATVWIVGDGVREPVDQPTVQEVVSQVGRRAAVEALAGLPQPVDFPSTSVACRPLNGGGYIVKGQVISDFDDTCTNVWSVRVTQAGQGEWSTDRLTLDGLRLP